MHSPIRVGLVGAGTSATIFHAPFITSNPSFNLVKFLRTSTTPVAGYRDVTVVSDLQDFLTSPPDIDLVVITTPTHTHFDLAKRCLTAGKHVVLEKPMAVTHQECLQLCKLSRSANRLLAVYQNRRWDGDFLTVKKLLDCGALGPVVDYESHFDRFRNAVKPGWKEEDLPGSGVLYDLGAHLIDQALTLFGPPSAVTANVLNQRQLPGSIVPDAFTVTLHYEAPSPHANLTAILRASMLAKIPGPRFLLHGTQGSFIKFELDAQEGQLRAGLSPTDPGFGLESPSCYGVLDSIALSKADWASPTGSLAPADPAAPAAVGATRATAVVDTNWVAATMQAQHAEGSAAATARAAGGGSGSSSISGAVVNVVTEAGRWVEFYQGVADILLGTAEEQQHTGGSASTAAGVTAAAAAGDLNSKLAVKPEQAAEVIRLIEAAMQSSKEGRTIRLV